MRWSAQELSVDQIDALPGLARLNNLVRSVRTPDFAGITFHEVLAKSALNRVPGGSPYMANSWTINPYRGCSHACAYCVSPDTLILMADGRQQPLWSVNVGDEIYGTEAEGSSRRYVKTTVLAKWDTRKRAHRVTLAGGTELIASGDHRFLSERGWTYVRESRSGAAQGPSLMPDDTLMGLGCDDSRVRGVPRISERTLAIRPNIEGAAVSPGADLRVVQIEDLGHEMRMTDITTGTGDFIANGVISHNCFARTTHEYLDLDAGRDFDSEIIVKVNLVEVLEKELARPSWRGEPVMLGTNTDPYQRAEGRYRLMPGTIAALAAHGSPLSILTKGSLLRRDLPLLQAAAERVPVSLAMSIAVFDPELQQQVEPGAPSTAARLDTVRAATDAGFAVSVFLMPVLPFLTDSTSHLDRALGMIAESGATSVMYSSLHLRGSVKPWYMAWLERDHAELVPRYEELYRGGAYAPKDYRRWLAGRVGALIRKHGLERPRRTRIDSGTGLLTAVDTDPVRAHEASEVLLAAELSPAAAAALQPTLF